MCVYFIRPSAIIGHAKYDMLKSPDCTMYDMAIALVLLCMLNRLEVSVYDGYLIVRILLMALEIEYWNRLSTDL